MPAIHGNHRKKGFGEGLCSLHHNHTLNVYRIDSQLQVLGFAIDIDRLHRWAQGDIVAATQPPEMDMRIDGHVGNL